MSETASPIDCTVIENAGRKLAQKAGERLTGYIAACLLQSLRGVAEDAGTLAGVSGETAAACYIHLCRDVCEGLLEKGRAAVRTA